MFNGYSVTAADHHQSRDPRAPSSIFSIRSSWFRRPTGHCQYHIPERRLNDGCSRRRTIINRGIYLRLSRRSSSTLFELTREESASPANTGYAVCVVCVQKGFARTFGDDLLKADLFLDRYRRLLQKSRSLIVSLAVLLYSF